jgi:hypothetical protein
MDTHPETHDPAIEHTLRSGRGRIYRCRHCSCLHVRFGNLAARLDAESFLRLANQVHQAATILGPDLTGDQRVVVPFNGGDLSFLLDRNELADFHSLMSDGLRWLDQPEETSLLPVH